MSAPPLQDGTADRCCRNCQRWSHAMFAIGDCRLGPPPERMWQPGVVLRMTAPDQACDAWLSVMDFEGYRAERRAAGGAR